MASAMTLATDLVPILSRGKVVGFRNFVAYIAMGFGMLLGNYLYVAIAPQMPFYATLGTIAFAFLIFLFLVHEPKERVGLMEQEKQKALKAEAARVKSGTRV